MKGLVTLVSGNLTRLIVFDENTGKLKQEAWLPQYAKANVWKRKAFSPDWHSFVWTKDGELFFGEYDDGGGINRTYGKTPVRIGGKPTYSGGKLSYTQPRFGPDGKRVYFLANNEKVYSADPKSPDDLKEELTLTQGTFFGDNGLSWDVAATGVVEKRQEVFPEKKHEATNSDGTKTIVQSGPGWYLKETGSSAEPKLLFEKLLGDDGESIGLIVDVIGWL
ncbi:hypothetical protein ACWCQL_31025 [Streptomyces sp. NPDC002073]